MEYLVRQAVLSDAGRLAEINVTAWAAAYRHLMPASYLASLSVAEYAAKWSERLSLAASSVLVAELGGELAGYVEFSPPTPPASCCELMAFYVHPRHWSQRVGRALWLVARADCLAAGASEVYLWVLAGNKRGIRFYEKAGFARDIAVSRTIDRGGQELEQLRYSQCLTATL